MSTKRNQKRRVVDSGPRHTRSDHGNNAKSNILYTPPIGKLGRNIGTSGGDSALLQRLEKITNEINNMQTYPNQQNQNQNHPPNQNYPQQYNPSQPHQQNHPQFSLPSGYPPSFLNASPRTMEYSNESQQIYNGFTQQQQPQELSPQRQQHQQDGSNQSHGATNTNYFSTNNQMNMPDNHMTLNMRSLQMSLAEAHEEHRRAMNRVELESNERRSLEQQNFELNTKLVEARQAVKDTQAALQSAQFATDQLSSKRSQREAYIKELSEVNTTNISRIATLEAKLKDAEDALLEGNARRDQFIHQIQSQLASSQEEVYAAQAEINTLNGLKCQAETELGNLRTRNLVTEQRLKDTENSIELTYKAKIAIMENKNQSLMDKIASEKHVYSQIQHLEEQLAHKQTALQRALESSKNAEISLHESVGQVRHQEELLQNKDADIQQLETKLVKYEAELKKEKQTSSQCKVLESEISSKNTEIKLINQSLHDTQTSLDEAILKVDSLSRELIDKDKDIQDLEQKLKHAVKMNMSERGFNEIISSMQSEITDMESSLMSERSTRKRAEEDAESFQIKIRSLEVNLRDKMATIAEKESDVKNLQKLVNFDHVKSSQVEEMEEKLHEVTHSLNLEIQSNRMAKRDLEKKDIKIQSLENAIQVKDANIQDLEDVIKKHSVNEVSDRIMNKTIQHLESQLNERDTTIMNRNEKISAIEQSLKDAQGRIRELETASREQDSELQNMLFKKQNAEREAIKLKTICQSLEGKIGLFEKQNETIESRAKILIFEKHEAVNKLEMLEKVVQDMAESTIDSASSIKEQQRLTEELRHANQQMTTLASDLEKSAVTIAVLKKSLESSDEQIRRLTSESHANFVTKKTVNAMKQNSMKQKKNADLPAVTEPPEEETDSEEQKNAEGIRSPSLGRSESMPPPKNTPQPVLKKASSSKQVITSSASFIDDLAQRQKPQSQSISPRTMNNNLLEQANASGIMGKRHETTSELAQITDFINSTTRDIEKISEKKKDMRAAIEAFTAEFKSTHNRQPTAEEKANAPDNIFTNYQQLSHILKKKNGKLQEAEEKFKKMQQAQQAQQDT